MSVALNEILTISPAGRASREAYWLSLFAALVLSGIAFVVLGFSPAAEALFKASGGDAFVSDPAGIALSFLGGVLLLLSIVLLTTAVIRRLHDLATSGWAALFLLIPVINLLALIAIGLLRGTSMNRFGPDPLTIPTIDRHTAMKAKGSAAPSPEEVETIEPVSSPTQEGNLQVNTQTATEAQASSPAFSIDSPAGRLYELARVQCLDETDSIRLQVKASSIEKLRKLFKKGRITEAEFNAWKMRIMSL